MIDRLRVSFDADGNVTHIAEDGSAILTLGKAVRTGGTGWHAYPMNTDGTLWDTPCYLSTRKNCVRYLAAFTAYADRVSKNVK
jgi:hypothetical protein